MGSVSALPRPHSPSLAARLKRGQDDWSDIPPKKTAWGTESEGGWWEVRLRVEDGRVGVALKGRMIKVRSTGHSVWLVQCTLIGTQKYPMQVPPLQLADSMGLSAVHVQALLKAVQERAKASVGSPMIFDVSPVVPAM